MTGRREHVPGSTVLTGAPEDPGARQDDETTTGSDIGAPAAVEGEAPGADDDPATGRIVKDDTVPRTGIRRRWLSWPRLVAGVLVALTVAVVATGVVFGLQVRSNRSEDTRRTEAVDVARQQAINLMTVNSENVDSQLNGLLDGTTGAFRREFEGVRDVFAQVVRTGEIDSKGVVDQAGVASLDEHSARVLLALTSTVSNAEQPQAQPRRYRIAVELERESDRWLVTKMEFVP